MLNADVSREERSEGQRAQIVQAYDGLLGNCYLERDFVEAESVLQEAIDAAPQSRAHFHFRLAEHYRLAGRPRESIAHFKRAGELSPEYKSKAETEFRMMGEDASGCLFIPTMRASR